MIISIRKVGNRSTVTFHPHPLSLLVWVAAMLVAFFAGAALAVLLLL